MKMTLYDWLIVIASVSFLIFFVRMSRRYVQSVADFLSAGRTAGRYMICVSQGMVMLGSVTIAGYWEINYVAGFSLRWWEFTMGVVLLLITVSGWVIYRFRQTRAMTMAQFFEIRYSRKFRIFAGLLAFISGILNFGIFPAIGGRFFIYFCGLPESFQLLGMEISTFPVVMLAFLSISLYFVFAGGQIAVIITEFLQGIFVNAVFIFLILFLFMIVSWDQILEALSAAPADASLLNPYHTSKVKDFNLEYFLIGMIGVIYGKLSWQGTQAYNSSAKSAHEAKMGDVLSNLRDIPKWLVFVVVPVVAYTIMRHPDFSVEAGNIQSVIDGMPSREIQSQLTVPMVLNRVLPVGFMGALAAVMLLATIGTHNSYMHSWGSIFIQDIIMPFRRKPFTPEQHMKVLRYSIVGVCTFIFLYSLFFPQSVPIFLYFAITAAIFVGGSGAVIIGGLYWKRGTTMAAYSALFTGGIISIAGVIIRHNDPEYFINEQEFWGIAMALSSLAYVAVSLLGRRTVYDMDKMLHRGKYAITGETRVIDEVPVKGWKMLGMGKEFTRGDKIIYLAAYAWTGIWTVAFIVGTYFNLTGEVSDASWMSFWRIFIIVNITASIIILVWFSIGGLRDLKEMLVRLRTMKRDFQDDGFVVKNINEEAK